MEIKQRELKQALDQLEPWCWCRTVWRRVGKKIVRFVDWRKLQIRKAAP